MSEAEPLSERQQSEVRHRFANAIQLVSALTRMRMQRAQDEQAKRQFSWLVDATGVIGLVQQRRLGAEPDDLGGLLRDMSPQWRRRCTGRPIQLNLAIDPLTAREHVMSAVAMVANELVTNALAHAFADQRAGCISVELRALEDGKAELIVSDDGCGYDPDTVGRSSLGLWLIQGLAQQVRGELTTTTEGGVKVRLAFAVQQEG